MIPYITPWFALIPALLVSGLLTYISKRNIPHWEQRGYSKIPLLWTWILALSNTVALLASTASILLGGGFWASAAISIVGWLTPLVVITDLFTYKIPREPCIAAYWLGLPLMAGFMLSIQAWSPLASFLAWMFLPALLFLIGSGGMGMGDIRLLILFGTTMSWWVGIQNMVFALMAAAMIQILLFPIAKLTGRGRKMERSSIAGGSIEETLEEELASVNDEIKEDSNEEEPTQEDEPQVPTELEEKIKGKKKLYLPFGPVLMIAFLGAALYSASTWIHPCHLFLGFWC